MRARNGAPPGSDSRQEVPESTPWSENVLSAGDASTIANKNENLARRRADLPALVRALNRLAAESETLR